jgi:hypothetical protein
MDASQDSIEVSVIQGVGRSRQMLLWRSLARRGSSQVNADLHFWIERVDPAVPPPELERPGRGEEPERAVQ